MSKATILLGLVTLGLLIDRAATAMSIGDAPTVQARKAIPSHVSTPWNARPVSPSWVTSCKVIRVYDSGHETPKKKGR